MDIYLTVLIGLLGICIGALIGHGENAMWKVVYNDNEWSLSGYPDNKVEISEWTEIY